MEYFLIQFNYDHYCQGWERANTTVLVKATSYEDAIAKIKDNDHMYSDAKNFINKTLE